MTFASQKTFFCFLIMIYDRVGDGDKFSSENFGLRRPHFDVNSHLKVEVNEFFS